MSSSYLPDARSIAAALGGEIVSRHTVVAPGPGHSAKDRSLAVRVDAGAPDGFLVFSHAGDDWKECRDYVRSRLGLPAWSPGDEQSRTVPTSHVEAWDLRHVEADVGRGELTEDQLARIAAAREIWDQGTDPRGTLAAVYLKRHRRLELPDELAGAVLRFHPACPWRDENTGRTERVPALIAAFRSIDTDAVTAIQRTRLNSDGSKHGRRMLGIVRHAAVKMGAVTDTVCIGEGVETCLAGRQLGFAPVWALGSCGAISFFPLLEEVKLLIVLGEAGIASAGAIKIVGRRWRNAGRRVRVVMPTTGSDLNDIVMEN